MIARNSIDWKAYDRWAGTDKEFALSIGMDANNFAQHKKRHLRTTRPSLPNETPIIIDLPIETVELTPSNSAVQSSADHSAELPSLPDPHPLTVQSHALPSAETLADHETRLQMLEGFMAALQAQARQVPVQHITVQSSADSAYALPSAAPVQTWDDPEDGRPERWNLWLPRGLKRRIEAQARAAGVAPSSLVQKLLMAAINGQAVHDA